MATQEVSSFEFAEVLDLDVWGKLLPLDPKFNTFELINLAYTFGRDEKCDYCFSSMKLRNHPAFLAYSNIHFEIERVQSATGNRTILKDVSSNGTFINGLKIGKNHKQVLNHNDEISLITKTHKAFVYMDQCIDKDKVAPEVEEKYVMSKILGRGSFGEVKLAFSKRSCEPYAIKIVKKKPSVSGNADTYAVKCAIKEAEILKSVDHPCIVRVEEVFNESDAIYIVLEFVKGGELFDRVANVDYLEESATKFLFYQIISAVEYLHGRGIVHRDLKPENILLSSESDDPLVKVSDFGISKVIDEKTMLKTYCGTPMYVAPEILRANSPYTNAVDCWSLGVLLYTCLAGSTPFSPDCEVPLVEQIIEGKYSFEQESWRNVSEEAIDLVKKLMKINPEERITLKQALEHPWFQDDDMIVKVNEVMYICDENSELQKNSSSDENDTTGKDSLNNYCNPNKKRKTRHSENTS